MEKEIHDRRPVRTRNTRWAARAARFLRLHGATPNGISLCSILCALLGALCFVTVWHCDSVWCQRSLLLLAVMAIQGRLICNLLDGMVAVEGGMRSPAGAVYNELPDRISDTLLLAMGSPPYPAVLHSLGQPHLGTVHRLCAASGWHLRPGAALYRPDGQAAPYGPAHDGRINCGYCAAVGSTDAADRAGHHRPRLHLDHNKPHAPYSADAQPGVSPVKLHIDKSLVQALLVSLCRLLTGVKSFWLQPPDPIAPTLYFANHSSHLDGLVIWASLPKPLRQRVHSVAAADYWQKTPLRRYLARRIFNAVLVERHRQSTSRDPLVPLVATLTQGDSLIFFPEGTRGDGETLGQFKSGLFHLAQRCPEARLVPVWLENMNRVLPKGSRLVVPIICRARFGEPITGPAADESKTDFLARATQALEALAHD